MARKRVDYTKMHLISQNMYEKLKKCLANDNQPGDSGDEKPEQPAYNVQQMSFDTSRRNIPETSDYWWDDGGEQEQPEISPEPIPGPSNINPETGEYWNIPEDIPSEFQYDEDDYSFPQPSNPPQTQPQSSMFESFIGADGVYRKPPKGKKTNDPRKIKSSKGKNVLKSSVSSFKLPSGQVVPVIRKKKELIVKRPLQSIPEEGSDIYIPPGSRDTEIADLDIENPPRPIRTSTPVPPSFVPQIRNEPQHEVSLNQPERREIVRIPTQPIQRNVPYIRSSPVKTRQRIKQIPLKSCNQKPVVKVQTTIEPSEIKNLPKLGKFKCHHCPRYLSTKYSLKRHITNTHRSVVRRPNGPPVIEEIGQESFIDPNPPQIEQQQMEPIEGPSDVLAIEGPQTFSSWVKTGKRLASETNLKEHQPKKFSSNPGTSKRKFDSWKL